MTMHYGLSNVIIRDQKFAKVCKSKTLFLAHFWTKRPKFFFKRSKTAKILQEIFFKYFSYEKMWKFWHLMSQNPKGWSHKLETLHVETLGTILKKPRKQKNYDDSPSLWNLHLKYTNICQKISEHGSMVKYLSWGFKCTIQLVPWTYYYFIVLKL